MFEDIWSDEPLTWESYVASLATPWSNIPQYRILTGQSALPEYSLPSVAASLTWSSAMWSIGMSSRALVGHIIANRYLMPLQTPVTLALVGVGLAMTSDHVLAAREAGITSPYRYAASKGAWNPELR